MTEEGSAGVRPQPSERDLATIRDQLDREPRGVLAVAARCVCGNPVVVITSPRLADGTPFPTFYYLTHPGAVAAVSRLEAGGAMRDMTARLAADPDLAAAYRAAHAAYVAARSAVAEVPEIAGVSAGGMPDRVKCLHVLVAHALAAGPGVNPLGDETIEAIRGEWSLDRCTCATPIR